MPVRASIDPKYVRQVALTAAVISAFSLWFLYDGLFTFPQQRVRALEYQRLFPEKEEEVAPAYQGLDEQERLDKWEEIATERGWSTKDPGQPKEDLDFQIQLVLGGVVAIPALWFIVGFFRVRGTWIEMDENGLTSSWGQQLTFDQIVSLNKKKWKKKGIAYVKYGQDGRNRTIVLDDWKYDTDPTVAILREIESHINVDQIVGGPPEPPPEEEHEEPDDDGEQEETDVPDEGHSS